MFFVKDSDLQSFHYYICLTAFSMTTRVSQHQKGRTILDFNETRDDGWQWHELGHMQTICTSLQTDNHASTQSVNFYRPDAFPDAQPTMSNH